LIHRTHAVCFCALVTTLDLSYFYFFEKPLSYCFP
jgi:hypothetical protein